jgi:hypothetical protein
VRTFGEDIRKSLQQLHVGIRKVDDWSRNHANKKHNGCLHISRYRLSEIGQNASDIRVAEIAELAQLCCVPFTEMLRRYLSYYPELLTESELTPSTKLLDEERARELLDSLSTENGGMGVLCTDSSAKGRNAAREGLWTKPSHHVYGMVGMEDWTMWPLLPPGSIVRVDTRQKSIARHGSWRNDYDRPIYFLEIRNGFACGWCDVCDRQLILTPHFLSPASPRALAIGRDVEVRGRVVGYVVDHELAKMEAHQATHTPESPTTSLGRESEWLSTPADGNPRFSHRDVAEKIHRKDEKRGEDHALGETA